MKKLKLFSLLMLLFVGVTSMWGATADVTYDFTTSGWTVSDGTLSKGTVSFTGEGTANFKMNDGYFIMGKSGAYITFPTYAKAVEKIVVTGRSGASGSTKMNIFVGSSAVSTETTGCTGTNTYNIASASQAAGTTYKLSVTSAHNAQITKIEIFYAAADPTVSVDPTNVAFGDVKQYTTTDESNWVLEDVAITGENLTDDVVITSNFTSVFNIKDPGKASGVAASLTIKPKDGAIDTTITVVAYTSTTGELNKTLTVSSAKETPEFTAFDIPVSINLIETFSVAVAVNDAEMGTATINGKSSVYTDGNDVLNIVATPKSGYEFVNWTVSDGDVLEVASATSATTTLTAIAEGTVTANFQAQTCTSLAAPEYQGDYITYQSIRLVWAAVDNAASYLVNIKQGETPIVENASTTECAYVKAGLTANTEYTITVMAVGSGTYCAENNPVLEKTYTLPDYPAATLAFSENGTARALAGDHKLKDVVKLPTEAAVNVYGKVLVGWTNKANKDYAHDTDAPEVFYAKGADYTIASEKDTLYAVYALETPGEATNYNLGSVTYVGGESVTSGYELTTNKISAKSGYVQDSGTAGSTTISLQVKSSSDTQIIPTAPSAITVTATLGGGSVKDPLDYSVYAVLVDNAGANVGDPVVLTTKITNTTGSEFSVSMPVANYANVRGFKVYHMKEDSWNVRYYTLSLSYTTAGPSTFSKYATTGLKQLTAPQFNVAAGTYTVAQSIELTATEGDIYYTLDGSEPTKESTKYTAAIALDTYGEHTIKAFAATETGRSDVAEATYKLNLPFASLEALVAQELPSETPNVTVSFANVEITDFGNSNKNVYLNVKDKDGENDILFFNYNALEEDWVVGGELSGTVTGTWKEYNSEWELVITSWTTGITYKAPAGIAWSTDAGKAYTAGNAASLPSLTNPNSLTVTYSSSDETVATISNEEEHEGEIKPLKAGTTTIKATFAGNESYIAKEVSYTLTVYAPTSVVITGDASKKEYFFNETFSFAGLGAKATYSDATDYVIPADQITWTPAEAPAITANATIEVTATWQGLTSDVKEIAVTKVLRELSLDEFAWSDYTAEVILLGHSAIPAVRSIVNTHNLPVTYRSGDSNKMEVNTTTGEITSFKASGAVAMFVEFAGNEEYAAVSRSYIIDIFGLDHVELSGEATKTAYEAGETFDHTGLVATAVYTLALEDPQNLDVTALAEWTATDIEANTTKVTATATWKDKSADKEVDVTVNLHEVTFADVENQGHVLVKLGDDNINSGDEFALGTELHVFAVPQDGYKATGITINGNPLEETSYEGEEIQVLAGQFIVGSEDIVIAATFEALPKYYLKNNWNGGSWTWKEMTPVSETNYILENVVFGGQGVNINTAASDEGAGWKALDWFAGDEIGALDTVTLALNPKTMVITATLLGKYVEPVVEHTYTVAGEPAAVFGEQTWDPTAEANNMVKQNDGTYKWEKTEITLPQGNVQFKVCQDYDWVPSWPAQNYVLSIPEDGIYTITITFDPAAEEDKVAAVATKTGSAEVDPVVEIGAYFTEEWTMNEMELSQDKKSASFTKTLALGSTIEFKIRLNGSDWRSNAHTFDRENNYYSNIVVNEDDNMLLVVDATGEYTFTWNFEGNSLEITYPDEPATEYYIAGSFTSWGTEKVAMTEDQGAWEKTITINATENQEFQVVRVKGLNETWYGLASAATMTSSDCENWTIGGGKANIGLDLTKKGDFKFVFVPAEMKLTVIFPTGGGTALDNTEAETKAVKFIENGQIFILRGDKVYTVDGQLVK